MDEIRTARCLDKLRKRRAVVVMTLRYLEKEQHEVDENNDWLDQAAYDSRVALLDHLIDGYCKEISQIDGAITRATNRKYGACVACHAPIETSRLEAFPEAEFCSACKEMREEFEQA
jgi:RNA polymerase-binding transcription factor DksA